MEPIHNLICVHLPDYFRALPIPDSFGGWFRLGGRCLDLFSNGGRRGLHRGLLARTSG